MRKRSFCRHCHEEIELVTSVLEAEATPEWIEDYGVKDGIVDVWIHRLYDDPDDLNHFPSPVAGA